ncbi:MAG: putative lipid II flippase FtsW [Candidatus Babeliales bacterium]
MFVERKRLQADLNIFLGIVTALVIIGLLFIYSASSVAALELHGSPHYFLKKQLIGLVVGLIAFWLARTIPLSFIKSISPLLFISALALTALTLVPALGSRIHGSARWLQLGSFSFQPSELLKVAFVLYLARFLDTHHYKAPTLKRYLTFLIIVGMASAVLLKQPDFGMTVTLSATAFLMLFIVHANLWHLFITLLAALPVVAALIYFKPYRWQRILTFLNPWEDPQGAGFQIIQSLIAIGSGSWLGIGVAQSKQKFFYLPMQHTDFIFSIIAEETGFVGATILILLYAMLLYFGMRIAWQLNDMFATLLTLGFVMLISLQAVINIAVACGLVPTKGIGLPFVSYGNSALVGSLIMVGLICNAVKNRKYV